MHPVVALSMLVIGSIPFLPLFFISWNVWSYLKYHLYWHTLFASLSAIFVFFSLIAISIKLISVLPWRLSALLGLFYFGFEMHFLIHEELIFGKPPDEIWSGFWIVLSGLIGAGVFSWIHYSFNK